MQVDKLCLYQVMSLNDLEPLMSQREWWLKGDYSLATIPDYVEGFVVAHIENDSCFMPDYQMTESGVLQVELPYALLTSLIQASSGKSMDELVTLCHVDQKYVLKPRQNNIQSVQYIATLSDATDKETIGLGDEQLLTEIEQPDQEHKPIKSAITLGKHPMRILFGHEALRQTPLYWEPTNTARFMNTNTGIIGTMGTGKTQFTKSLITQLMRQQESNVNSASKIPRPSPYKSSVNRPNNNNNNIKIRIITHNPSLNPSTKD